MQQSTKKLKIKLFTFLTISLGVLLIFSISTTYFFNQQHSLSTRYYSLKTLSQDIIYYDEVLTMSALMNIHSEDARWRTRYAHYTLLLEDALERAAKLDSSILAFIKETMAANQLLVSYEKKAFDLVNKNQQQQAIALLNSQEYLQYKMHFTQGINSAANKVLIETETALDKSQKQRGLNLLIGMIISFIIVICLWGYLIRYIQVTDRAIEDLIGRDELSGLLNRRMFKKATINELNRSYRENTIMMLAEFDIDNFKKYNDSYGHPEGDKVIHQIGGVLEKYSQRTKESVYRIGGEEFALIGTYETKHQALEQISIILEQIRKLNIPHQYNESYNRVTVSCGVAFALDDKSISFNDLYRYADEALYAAKKSGKNQFIVFNQ